MAFGAAAVNGGAVFLDVVFSAAANQVIEFLTLKMLELDALAAGSQTDPAHNCTIESQPIFRRSFLNRDLRFCTEDSAANIVAHRAHGNGAFFSIGQQHAAYGNAVAIMGVRR